MTSKELRQRDAERVYNVLQAVTALLNQGAPTDDCGCCCYCDAWLEEDEHLASCAWARLQNVHAMRCTSQVTADAPNTGEK